MKEEKANRQKDLISIIVPVYNAKMFIVRCVNSIQAQTYSKIQLILVDDGSTDGSAELCDQMEKEDQRIKVIHCANGGAASARNQGLDIAQGEYIMFVDSDDYIDSRLCEILLDDLKESHAKCCLCGYQTVEENKKDQYISAEEKITFTGKEAIRKRYIDGLDYVNIINPWGKLYHWSMWKELRFTSGMYYEDLDIMPYLYLKCEKVVCVPETGYYYTQRIGSCSNGIDTDDKRYIDSLKIRKKHVAFFKENEEEELARAVMKKTVELIITSDCRAWIPVSYKDESKQVFQSYLMELLNSGEITGKVKLRCLLYRYLGKKIYNICIWHFSRKGNR